MGQLLTQCCVDYVYPYLDAKEKLIITATWEKFYATSLNREKPKAMRNCRIPTTVLAIGAADNALAVDTTLRAKVSQEKLLVCDFLSLVVMEFTLNQEKVTGACETFSLNHICSGNITLSYVGVIISELVATMKSDIFGKCSTDAPMDSIGDENSQIEKIPVEIRAGTSAKEMCDAWKKFSRYCLACMSETYELHLRLQERYNYIFDSGGLSRRHRPYALSLLREHR